MNELSNSIANGFIHAYRDYVQRAHALSEKLSEEHFWTKPYPYGNSFGHLTLHIIGNLNYYIGAQIAGTGYVRDREREFTESAPPSKAEVIRRLDEAVEMVIATLEAQSAESWAKAYEAENLSDFIKDRFSIFLRCATHFHHHVGQMIYLEKEFSKVSYGPGECMHNISRESENEAVKRSLESSYCPEPIREARERQDRLLGERLRPGLYKIADVGCGNGYHAVMLAPVSLLYHGFEISTAIADTARSQWQKENIDNAQIFVGEVAEVDLKDEFYDVVLCLYFTPGNFRDRSDDLSLYSDAYLDRNPQFIRIMSRFYRAMKIGGSMFLTIYKDAPEAEAAQVDFYENTGQHVVTLPGSRFVATAEGFWSARWTRDSMLSNLSECGISPDRVVFNDLNAIAWLVEIKK